MTQWLLKNEGYPPAVLVSLLLHGLVLVLIFIWSRDNKDFLRIEQPATIIATAARENPQRVRQQETKRKQQQKDAQERDKVKEQERQHQEALAKDEAERQKLVQLQKQQAEDQKRKQEEQKQQSVAREENQKREKEKQQQTVKDQAQREADQARQRAAQQRALTEEQQLVAKYEAQIKELIESNWSRPAGARKDTVALIELQLTPTGEIVSRLIVQSSGDSNFDDTVRRAVDKAGRFNFLIELNGTIFNRYFRKFTLEFKPGDAAL